MTPLRVLALPHDYQHALMSRLGGRLYAPFNVPSPRPDEGRTCLFGPLDHRFPASLDLPALGFRTSQSLTGPYTLGPPFVRSPVNSSTYRSKCLSLMSPQEFLYGHRNSFYSPPGVLNVRSPPADRASRRPPAAATLRQTQLTFIAQCFFPPFFVRRHVHFFSFLSL